MFFSTEPPRAAEVITAAAATAASSASPPPPPADRSSMLRGKPRSRLPLPNLKAWANQRLLKCVRLDGAASGSDRVTPASKSSRRRMAGGQDGGFDQIREKLMDHLRQAADRIELPAVALAGERRTEPAAQAEAPIEESSHAASSGAVPPVAASVYAEDLPWNLRTRRSTPASNARSLTQSQATSRLSSGTAERREAALRRRRPRFSLPLTKEEIDEDLYAFTGRLAPRRPKKRSRSVQKQLDMLFPGLCLSEVTAEMYQVADPPPPPPP
ncbi:unnamed protein product [Spirodela intermedia]|uniref:Uncharacterized protein n=1 Tax=Spirodela intermedia TaxID=51605 RepID=A0A7I8LEI0_SPIIN|nr:unnamed protein product [Spirodela intermedia]